MAAEGARAVGSAPQSSAETIGADARASIARNAPLLIAIGAVLYYLNFLVRGSVAYKGQTYFTLFDDAMISLRYAKTLAAGGGFTWNPGEVPIEGITNPLWTLWMALLHFAPVHEGQVALLVGLSAAACLIGAAFGARRLARQLGASEATALVVLAFAAFYYPLAFWSLRGMETGVLACLMTWAMVLAIDQIEAPAARRTLILAAIAATVVWVRQDSVVFVIVLTGFLGLAGGPRLRAPAFALAAAMVLALAAMTLARLAYYGEALPNTYYLKVTGVTLAERLHRGVGALLSEEMRGHFILFVAVLALASPALARTARAVLIRMTLPLAAFLAQVAYSAYVGGDVWELMGYPNRYLVIAMPGLIALTLVLAARVADTLVHGGGRGGDDVSTGVSKGVPAAGLLLVAITGLLFIQTSVKHAVLAYREGPAYSAYDRAATQVGLCLREVTAPGTRIAYTWAGAMPYYADRIGIDLLGKMDPVIARGPPQIAFEPGHNKWNYAYSVDTHQPDIVLQLFRAKPGDHEMIRALGYEPVSRDWQCLENTFLTPEDVLVRRKP